MVATAREVLLDEIWQLNAARANSLYREKTELVLAHYRVQAKAQKDRKNVIAREALLEDINFFVGDSSWSKAGLALILQKYRVQRKEAPKIKANKSSKKGDDHLKSAEGSDVRKTKALISSGKENISSQTLKGDPIAGGPRIKPAPRASCPKCHGESVTSAPSTTENYIYCYLCGWRKYSTGFDSDMNCSLGKEIFSRVFDGDDHK